MSTLALVSKDGLTCLYTTAVGCLCVADLIGLTTIDADADADVLMLSAYRRFGFESGRHSQYTKV